MTLTMENEHDYNYDNNIHHWWTATWTTRCLSLTGPPGEPWRSNWQAWVCVRIHGNLTHWCKQGWSKSTGQGVRERTKSSRNVSPLDSVLWLAVLARQSQVGQSQHWIERADISLAGAFGPSLIMCVCKHGTPPEFAECMHSSTTTSSHFLCLRFHPLACWFFFLAVKHVREKTSAWNQLLRCDNSN